MARKKKTVSKPVDVISDINQPTDLPSIQEEIPVAEVKSFLDPCEVLETEVLDLGDGEAKDVWSKFNTNHVCTPLFRLEYTEPIKVGDQIVARIDLDEAEAKAELWKNSIVCIVLGANPPFRVDEETRVIILETGVVHFDSKPVVLRPWSMDMDAASMVRSIPVWLRLNGLGLQYWGKENLSALVSTVGRQIMVDKVTQSRSIVKYARVLVDMEIQQDPPMCISFINEKKQLVEQLIEYEWLPSKCAACENLGHIVEVLEEDAQYAHCKMKICILGDEFLVTTVYGSNSKNERKVLWDNLAALVSRSQQHGLQTISLLQPLESSTGNVRDIRSKFLAAKDDLSRAQEDLARDPLNPIMQNKEKEKQVNLIRPFYKKVVKKALFNIHSSKSPGFDGFGSGFFKGLWNEIGDDLTNVILDFFPKWHFA
uniref:DUF4283 domain-containing protein n=1 Tax=Cannabis sativa TaxID=3483 RepID=A0A803Q873_CANSA